MYKVIFCSNNMKMVIIILNKGLKSTESDKPNKCRSVQGLFNAKVRKYLKKNSIPARESEQCVAGPGVEGL